MRDPQHPGPRNGGRPAGVPRCASSYRQLVSGFVETNGGSKPITSILIANNGMAAVKFIHSVRKWAFNQFGNEKAITLVAMATHEDIRCNAEHVRMADQFVTVPSGPSANNYGNIELIARTAVQAAVDACWPGWGHASEKPELPALLEEHDMVFLGPGERAMAALGDKIGSSLLAQAAGVPTLPWSGSHVALSSDSSMDIPAADYRAACVHSLDDALESCRKIGYPVMLKASWGGGGKGIRKVHSDDDVRLVYKQVQGEVPGSPIFTMKLAPRSRHLEVQLLCDQHGGVASLYTRDCSIQRRHQKIVEEGPAVAADAARLAEMEACARRLAALVGYVGAATVEFLYVLDEQQYYFLELNPRLQVEHPVTEWLTGVNIPACQVMIGMGLPLCGMPDIKTLFGQPADAQHFELDHASRQPPDGHVVAMRITSEHAEDGFKPTCGAVDELNFRSTPEVWGYFSIKSGGKVHEYADSQFGHVFAKAPTRTQAVRALVVALKNVRIRGAIRTLVDYAVEMLLEPEFVANEVHTGWLDARISAQVRVERPPWHLSVTTGAVLLAFQQLSANMAECLHHLERGQMPSPSLSLTTFHTSLLIDTIKYSVAVSRTAPDEVCISMNGTDVHAVARQLSDGCVLVQVDGGAHLIHGEEEPAVGTRLIIDNLSCLLAKEQDPSRLLAQSPGKLVRFLVPDGARLDAGSPYAELEVMKQIMLLTAPAAGHIHFQAAEGSVLAGGDLMARLDLENPDSVATGVPWTQPFPELVSPQVQPEGLYPRYSAALHAADMLLEGYVRDPDEVLSGIWDVLRDPELPAAIWVEELAAFRGQLPEDLYRRLEQARGVYRAPSPAPGPLAGSPPTLSSVTSVGSNGTAGKGGRHDADGPGLAAGNGGPGRKVGGGSADLGPDRQASGTNGAEDVVDGSAAQQDASPPPFPARQLREALLSYQDNNPLQEQRALAPIVQRVREVLGRLDGGATAVRRHVARRVLQRFIDSESAFASTGGAEAEVLARLKGDKGEHVGGSQQVLDAMMSHRALPRKVQLAWGIVTLLVLPCPQHFDSELKHLARFSTHPSVAPLAQRAQQLREYGLLVELSQDIAMALAPSDPGAPRGAPSWGGRESSGLHRIGSKLSQHSAEHGDLKQAFQALTEELDSCSSLRAKEDVLTNAPCSVEVSVAMLLDSEVPEVREAAARIYIRRLYEPFLWGPVQLLDADCPAMQWVFRSTITAGCSTVFARQGFLLLPETLGELSSAIRSLAQHSTGAHHTILHIVCSTAALHPSYVGPEAAALAEPTPITDTQSTVDALLAPPSDTSADSALEECLNALLPELVQLQTVYVACLCVQMQARVYRVGFKVEVGGKGVVRSSVLGCVAPPTAMMLELETLPTVCAYVPSYARRLQTFITQESAVSSFCLKRAFVRATCRAPLIPSPSQSIAATAVAAAADPTVLPCQAFHHAEATLCSCLEHLLRLQAQLSTPVDWAQVFIHILLPEQLQLLSSKSSDRRALTSANGDLRSTGAGGGGELVGEQAAREAAAKAAQPGDREVASALRAAAAAVVARNASAMRRVAVAEWCCRIYATGMEVKGEARPAAWRVMVSLPSGHELGEDTVSVFREVASADTASATLVPIPVCSPNSDASPPVATAAPAGAGMLPRPVLEPVPALLPLQQRRLRARRHNTTYCYDFPAVFEAALQGIWHAHVGAGRPRADPPLLQAAELNVTAALDYGKQDAELTPVCRGIGENTVGIVVWEWVLRTPEWPQGRKVVAVANDITHESGVFGPPEHALFRAACDYAVRNRLPLIYLAANSGARVGLDNSLKRSLRVKWADDNEPWKGFEYLFITDADHEAFVARFGREALPFYAVHVAATPAMAAHWRLTDVIGAEDGLGVECLAGSAASASAFIRAYRRTFTLTFVSGRTVGIGAYLARLGQRVIQRNDQPIILTGYQALNKLLGRAVYTSQLQLGGPAIMGGNGVSHLVVPDDLEGARESLSWLAFVPQVPATHLLCPSFSDASVRATADSGARPVTYLPPSHRKFNVRGAIEGCPLPSAGAAQGAAATQGAVEAVGVAVPEGGSMHGLFDAGTWVETLKGWGRTVVTGRARLMGLPVGVVGVETETVLHRTPADPGMPDSRAHSYPQAGQVWFPDSAAKTAQAIEDFDREGLPLLVLANWRGFSGGQRALFEGILQAGSCIVGALVSYRHPVVVYLPPGCELRGGAWVVIDPQINDEAIEMFADPGARGSVLEAEGIVEIKFRKKELLDTMNRIDPLLQGLNARQHGAGHSQVEAAIRARQEQLLPIYHSVAMQFAVMHESPARMLKKGVIRAMLPWKHARNFIAMRFRRKLQEQAAVNEVMCASPETSSRQARQLVRGWLHERPTGLWASRSADRCAGRATVHEPAPGSDYEDMHRWDAAIVDWLNSEHGRSAMALRVSDLRRDRVCGQVREALGTSAGRAAVIATIGDLAKNSSELRGELEAMLARVNV